MPIHLDVDIGRLPEVELGDVRAGAITARDKRRALLLDGLERRNNVLAAVDAGGIALWSDQDEVVVHHRVALYAEPIGDEFFLGCLGVDKHNVGVPATTGIECLPGSLCEHLHIDAGLGFEQGEYVAEQARVLRRGR
jgi:hypothetical protein